MTTAIYVSMICLQPQLPGGHGTRVLLDIDVRPPRPAHSAPACSGDTVALCMALPMYALSDRALLFELHALKLQTRFIFAIASSEWLSQCCVEQNREYSFVWSL
jgi:hypothetical protein